MLKTLWKRLITRPQSGFLTIGSQVFRRVFHNLWKTFQHNRVDKVLCQVGKLPIFPSVPALSPTLSTTGGGLRRQDCPFPIPRRDML